MKDIFDIICKSAMTMSVVMFIIATSSILSWILANWNIPTIVANGILAMSSNKYIIMLLITTIILITGIFMETASALIILTPVFLPLIERLGIDLIHFGIVMVMGLAIGMITPPVAINLYVASTITDLPIETITKAILPYLFGLIVVLLLILYLPLVFPIIL
jgi:C4-dicarboxylate transporter DctM subunit